MGVRVAPWAARRAIAPGRNWPPIIAAGRMLASRPGGGVSASVRVSSRSGLVNVGWVAVEAGALVGGCGGGVAVSGRAVGVVGGSSRGCRVTVCGVVGLGLLGFVDRPVGCRPVRLWRCEPVGSAGPVEGVLVRDDVDHDSGRGWGEGGGAVLGVAEARQPVSAVGQRADGVGAALILGAWVGGADGVGQRGDSGVEGLGVGGEQGGEHGGHAAAVFDGDVHRPAAGRGLGPVHRVRIDLGDERVDAALGLPPPTSAPTPRTPSARAVSRARRASGSMTSAPRVTMVRTSG